MSSCVFTFGESSVWDPKAVREYLEIPEDQLDILRNLPEWSKSRQNDDACRIEKDTCENSQPSQLISNVTLERNEKLITQNRVLFDDSFEIRKNILETYKLKSSKLFRSYSLFEIDTISNSSFNSDHLRSTLSVPNVCEFADSFHQKLITSELRKRNSPDRNSVALNIDLPVYKGSGKAYITEKTNKDTPELEKNKDTIYSEKSNMEVDAQLPITIPCIIKDQVKNNETNVEVLSEDKEASTSDTLNSPNKQSLLTSQNKFQSSISGVNIKAATLTTAVNINLCEKNNVDINIENIPGKSSNQEESETRSKLMKSGSPNSYENNEPVLNTIEKTHTDADITNENKEDETNVNLEVPAKANKTSDHGCESDDVSRELPTFKASLVSSKEPTIKISCNSSLSEVTVENDQQMIDKDVGDNKPFADTLSVKRKLESKSRSKKRRKQGCKERNIKKAGDICYSVEHIKTMLDIMKQFI